MNFLEHFLQKLAYLYISCTIFCPQSDCIQVYRTMFGISEAFYSIKETGTSEHFSAHVGSFIWLMENSMVSGTYSGCIFIEL